MLALLAIAKHATQWTLHGQRGRGRTKNMRKRDLENETWTAGFGWRKMEQRRRQDIVSGEARHVHENRQLTLSQPKRL